MLKTLLSLFLVFLIVGCSKQEPPAAAMPEVNDANCLPQAVKRLPEASRKKFAGLCLRRGNLEKGSDHGLKL